MENIILLTRTIENLVQNQAKNRLVFFWDEMPYMLDSISERESEETAIAVLDVLRSYRQTHEDLRMVITGSIGLHHVITKLKDTNYKNEPLNDLYTVDVPPLAPNDAENLAKTLIRGENLDALDIDDSATVIAVEGDYFPYYIHHIVRFLKTSGKQVNSETIRESVQKQLVDANDPWELGHFRDRLPMYYPQDTEFVFAILDCLATQDKYIDADSIFADVKSQIEFNDRNHLLKLLRLLESDHYLKRDLNGNYSIRFPLIQRWWKLDRGL